ncbi:MAG: winged helix-turn-helix transcriptional regulator [Methanoculleus sp.]
MARRSLTIRLSLVAFSLLMLSAAVCATPIQPVYGAYPEKLPSDPTPLYFWNEPLSILILEFVCVSAPMLFIPVQLLLSLSVWLWLGQKRLMCRNVLENEVRNAVYTCIRQNPGVHVDSLSRMLGMNIGTLRYHVGVLCRVGKVVAEQNSRRMSYYANTGSLTDLEKKVAGFLDEHPKSRILSLVLQHPGITRKDIASRLIMSGPNVTWHMSSLTREGVVKSEKDGRNMRYYLCPDVGACIAAHKPWLLVSAGKDVSDTGA